MKEKTMKFVLLLPLFFCFSLCAMWSPLHEAAYCGDRLRVQQLANPATVDSRDPDGMTPLHWTAFMGHLEITRLLLDRGANINALTDDNWAPLYFAARRGHLEVVRLLALLGADVEARDNSGRTPTDVAINQNIKNYLRVIFPASMKLLTAAAENNIIDLKNAIAHGADVNAFDKNGNTPLHFAAQQGNWQAIYALLVGGADVNAVDRLGATPLHVAAKRGNWLPVNLLLIHGANPLIENNENETPILTAVLNNQYNILGLCQMVGSRKAADAQAFSQFLTKIIPTLTQPKQNV